MWILKKKNANYVLGRMMGPSLLSLSSIGARMHAVLQVKHNTKILMQKKKIKDMAHLHLSNHGFGLKMEYLEPTVHLQIRPCLLSDFYEACSPPPSSG